MEPLVDLVDRDDGVDSREPARDQKAIDETLFRSRFARREHQQGLVDVGGQDLRPVL